MQTLRADQTRRHGAFRRHSPAVVVTGLAVALFTGACTGGRTPSSSTSATPASSASAPAAGPASIPQPLVAKLSALTRRRLAPDSRRVDLVFPTFSNPTEVTNPLFPVAELHSGILVGEVHGQLLKVEITPLPQTKTVAWNGHRITCLQSQFLAYLKGRITESAVDLYAEADDGSVWYLGEDVTDYANGFADTTAGTWVVGLDGPPAMIMPAHPQVGDVYRTENIPASPSSK
jgi:hypothetical protein